MSTKQLVLELPSQYRTSSQLSNLIERLDMITEPVHNHISHRQILCLVSAASKEARATSTTWCASDLRWFVNNITMQSKVNLYVTCCWNNSQSEGINSIVYLIADTDNKSGIDAILNSAAYSRYQISTVKHERVQDDEMLLTELDILISPLTRRLKMALRSDTEFQNERHELSKTPRHVTDYVSEDDVVSKLLPRRPIT